MLARYCSATKMTEPLTIESQAAGCLHCSCCHSIALSFPGSCSASLGYLSLLAVAAEPPVIHFAQATFDNSKGFGPIKAPEF
jgi:hypothetical protein